MREDIYIPSTDGKNKLHVVIWKPETDYSGIVQISHGMTEHVMRFNGLAEYLNNAGYLVIGSDHLGHGLTAATPDDYGYFGEGLSATVVDDLHEVTKYAKANYGDNIPYVLFGHSMGSFMARRYCITYGYELTSAIFSGTGYTAPAILSFGKGLTSLVGLVKGQRYRSQLIKNIAFGAYNKRIPDKKTESDWLTKDEKIVEAYLQDEKCTFSFTVNGYKTLFDSIAFIQKKDNVDKMNKDLPIFMISGEEDPVGEYGNGVRKAEELYKAAGIKNMTVKLYPNDRHELTNELDKDVVMKDILDFIEKTSKN